MSLSETLYVELGERSYPIYIGHKLLVKASLIEKHIASNSVFIVTNETIAPIYLNKLEEGLGQKHDVKTIVLPDGEKFKTLEYVNKIFDALLENRCNRQVTLIGPLYQLVRIAADKMHLSYFSQAYG